MRRRVLAFLRWQLWMNQSDRRPMEKALTQLHAWPTVSTKLTSSMFMPICRGNNSL